MDDTTMMPHHTLSVRAKNLSPFIMRTDKPFTVRAQLACAPNRNGACTLAMRAEAGEEAGETAKRRWSEKKIINDRM